MLWILIAVAIIIFVLIAFRDGEEIALGIVIAVAVAGFGNMFGMVATEWQTVAVHKNVSVSLTTVNNKPVYTWDYNGQHYLSSTNSSVSKETDTFTEITGNKSANVTVQQTVKQPFWSVFGKPYPNDTKYIIDAGAIAK